MHLGAGAVRTDRSNVSRFAGHKDEVCGLRFSPSEGLLASGANDNTCAIWDMRRLPVLGRHSLLRKDLSLHRFSEHIAAVKALSWSPAQVCDEIGSKTGALASVPK